jgi:uncharacterized protein YjbJ (UPF0337 family)
MQHTRSTECAGVCDYACAFIESTYKSCIDVEGNWKQFKGKVKQQWGKLTDDHLDVIAGKRDQLAGKIQESYGITKDKPRSRSRIFTSITRTKDSSVPPDAAPCTASGRGGIVHGIG